MARTSLRRAKLPKIENLVAVSWDKLPKPDEHGLGFFESLYVMNATNVNFMFQKILQSHIGTKGVIPAPGTLAAWSSGDHCLYTVMDKTKGDKPIAVGTICNINFTNRIGEIKFIIRPDYYGRGYTRAVLLLMLKEAFDRLLLNTVVVCIIKDKKTYPTANSILKTQGCRKVGALFDWVEVDGNLKTVYMFQCTLEGFRGK